MPKQKNGIRNRSGMNAWTTAVLLGGIIAGHPGWTSAGETLAALPSASETAHQNGGYTQNLQAVVAVLKQIAALPEEQKQVLQSELKGAQGIAVFPGLTKSGLFFAKLYGRGVLSYREFGKDWSPPILLTLQGRSWGPQIGMEWVDVLVIFHTTRSVENFLAGKLNVSLEMLLGSALGQAGSTEDGQPEIMTYIFRRGLLVGQSMDEFSVTIDETANQALYGEAMKAGATTKGVRIGPRWPPFVKQYVDRVHTLSGEPVPPPGQIQSAIPEQE
jgi:lipid-binding SYLF domain-containing protein